ncbi:MAG: hypothetical protein HY329_19250 [Chloroflexi bacterium]|nr:hypothetical protein [Chloroflexota bacterium]
MSDEFKIRLEQLSVGPLPADDPIYRGQITLVPLGPAAAAEDEELSSEDEDAQRRWAILHSSFPGMSVDEVEVDEDGVPLIDPYSGAVMLREDDGWSSEELDLPEIQLAPEERRRGDEILAYMREHGTWPPGHFPAAPPSGPAEK